MKVNRRSNAKQRETENAKATAYPLKWGIQVYLRGRTG